MHRFCCGRGYYDVFGYSRSVSVLFGRLYVNCSSFIPFRISVIDQRRRLVRRRSNRYRTSFSSSGTSDRCYCCIDRYNTAGSHGIFTGCSAAQQRHFLRQCHRFHYLQHQPDRGTDTGYQTGSCQPQFTEAACSSLLHRCNYLFCNRLYNRYFYKMAGHHVPGLLCRIYDPFRKADDCFRRTA